MMKEGLRLFPGVLISSAPHRLPSHVFVYLPGRALHCRPPIPTLSGARTLRGDHPRRELANRTGGAKRKRAKASRSRLPPPANGIDLHPHITC